MKKFVLMLAAALPLAFASCGDDNDEVLTLDQTSATMNYNAEMTLKASEKNCTWESTNPFVATVDGNGKVEAEHVGEAVIIATDKNGNQAKCNIVVNATNNNFAMPIITWGSKLDDVKAAVSKDFAGLVLNEGASDANTLAYTTGDTFPFYVYSFVNNGLKASSLTVTEAMDSEQDLEGYLEQRYEEYGETEYGYLYMNAENRDKATILVEYGYDPDVEAVVAVWTNATIDVRSGELVNRNAINMNRAAIRKIVKK